MGTLRFAHPTTLGARVARIGVAKRHPTPRVPAARRPARSAGAPKGRDIPAQGNALGMRNHPVQP